VTYSKTKQLPSYFRCGDGETRFIINLPVNNQIYSIVFCEFFEYRIVKGKNVIEYEFPRRLLLDNIVFRSTDSNIHKILGNFHVQNYQLSNNFVSWLTTLSKKKSSTEKILGFKVNSENLTLFFRDQSFSIFSLKRKKFTEVSTLSIRTHAVYQKLIQYSENITAVSIENIGLVAYLNDGTYVNLKNGIRKSIRLKCLGLQLDPRKIFFSLQWRNNLLVLFGKVDRMEKNAYVVCKDNKQIQSPRFVSDMTVT